MAPHPAIPYLERVVAPPHNDNPVSTSGLLPNLVARVSLSILGTILCWVPFRVLVRKGEFAAVVLIATVCILLPQAHAFGAGDIPDFAYLNGELELVVTSSPIHNFDYPVDKAFRHGDIESILENLAKTAGGAAIGGSGLFGGPLGLT